MNKIAYWIAIVALIFAVLFIIRSVILWYFKIDERTELMKETNRLLKELLDRTNPKG